MEKRRHDYSVLRDPVHGDLYLTKEELRVLDTPQMQRLRGIRQLGTAYLVYPGAQHTRFEHSLGTLGLTARLVDAINLNRSLQPRELLGIPEEETRILRLAALVHDVTHMPFGHNIEDQSGILERHDSPPRFRRMLAPRTELGRALQDLGVLEDVLALLLPAGEPGLPEVPPYWRELGSDTICPDILDYLRRDAYYTGLNLLYDDRVFNYFKVDRASGHLFVDVARRGMVREDILSEILRVLEARYFFSERVYYHHAKIAAGAMVARAVENALADGAVQPEELYEQTDESLISLLEQRLPRDPELAERQRELLARFRSRKLLKRACVFPRYANEAVQESLLERYFAPGRREERARFEREVEQRLAGPRPPLVTLYCPARHMQLKEVHTHVRFPGQERVRPLSELGAQVPRLADLEQAYRNLWKLYVLVGSDDPRVLARVAEVVKELLPEATNTYAPGR